MKPLRVLQAALVPILASALASCSIFGSKEEYAQASPALQAEIDRLVLDLQFQHSEELLRSDQRLIYIGEPAIPELISALDSKDAKTRSNVAYVLGEIRDRRVVPHLRPLLDDKDLEVRYETATSLVILGDWDSAVPCLLEGLRDPDKWNRYKAFAAMKGIARQDFGYEWQSTDASVREPAIRRFEEWWHTGGHVARATP